MRAAEDALSPVFAADDRFELVLRRLGCPREASGDPFLPM